ncbi:hypothetical protein [Kibdelosporangium phytohabitans]|uniref:Uncharacterized protein n=1 Tax=Kibdelosporangium phytohabitans TaxID=860235 RepID=A0A0N9I386_9PSEU|nr:hypothetical protein [Kibdelosporangium phytohabitans]ALG12250.1 hypothetical protein AOZ06_40140 [Kibdelosporangium phytohabitans]MBE1463795.1 hypothetical protein [Kibdelosporangium phytohabitans]
MLKVESFPLSNVIVKVDSAGCYQDNFVNVLNNDDVPLRPLDPVLDKVARVAAFVGQFVWSMADNATFNIAHDQGRHGCEPGPQLRQAGGQAGTRVVVPFFGQVTGRRDGISAGGQLATRPRWARWRQVGPQ